MSKHSLKHCFLVASSAFPLWALVLVNFASADVTEQDLANYRDWGLEVAVSIENDLRRGDEPLYAERANLNGDQIGGINGYAFAWAAATQLRVRNSLLELEYTDNRRDIILGMSDQLHTLYWENSSDGENGYVVAPGSTERYYDDNAHFTVALMEAYELIGEQRLLDRAILAHEFVLEGEDSHQGGGIYFREGDFQKSKNTISTLQEARGAAMIYKATGQQQFLDDATRLLQWTNSHVQRSDGLYYQVFKADITDIDNVPLTNAAGMGIITNLEMYDITGDYAYLEEAQRVGQRAGEHYVSTANGRIFSEGQWAFELADAFVDLYERDGDHEWLELSAGALEFLRANIEDENGHYGLNWNFPPANLPLDAWNLLDQAAVARAYLYTGLAEAPLPSADFDNNRYVNGEDFLTWQSNAITYRGATKAVGDADFNGTVDEQDLAVWKSQYGGMFISPASTVALPEPSSVAMLLIAVGAKLVRQRLI